VGVRNGLFSELWVVVGQSNNLTTWRRMESPIHLWIVMRGGVWWHGCFPHPQGSQWWNVCRIHRDVNIYYSRVDCINLSIMKLDATHNLEREGEDESVQHSVDGLENGDVLHKRPVPHDTEKNVLMRMVSTNTRNSMSASERVLALVTSWSFLQVEIFFCINYKWRYSLWVVLRVSTPIGGGVPRKV